MCQFFCSQFHDLRKVLNHWKYEHQCQRQYLGYHRRVRLQTQHFSKGRRKHSIWHRRKYQQTESLGPSLDAVGENVQMIDIESYLKWRSQLLLPLETHSLFVENISGSVPSLSDQHPTVWLYSVFAELKYCSILSPWGQLTISKVWQ